MVFLSGIPITIGMNGLRIGMVGVTVDRWGTQMAEGVLHFFEGWIIFVACAGILVAEIYLFRANFGQDVFSDLPLPDNQHVKPLHAKIRSADRQLALMSCLILLLCSRADCRIRSLIGRNSFRTAPALPLFRATLANGAAILHCSMRLSKRALAWTTISCRITARPTAKPVNLYVAYYSSQRNGYAPHSPLFAFLAAAG